MPRRLLDRCQPDSIREFRASAHTRYHDGLRLALDGRRTGAIYLWGYTAEMVLKASYFSTIGIAENQPLTWGAHIRPAIITGRQQFQILWPNEGQGHNVRAWAELLVAARALAPAGAYPQDFGLQIQRCGQRIGQLWRETLRYHKNRAYLHEMTQVREAAEWLLVSSNHL